MDLVELVYRATTQFPRDELYAVTSQLRRAAVSIPSNIAEGQGRGSDPAFIRFLRIAYGSLREVETQCLIAHRLQYMNQELLDRVLELAGEVGRLLIGLVKSKEQ